MTAHGHRVRFVATWREEFFEVPFNDPGHWRARAIEARAVAEHLNDPISKEMMLKVAADYEKLAKRAEERAENRKE